MELLCETDFVAKNEEFKALAKDIAMQIAATDAEFLSKDDIDEASKVKVREVLEKEVSDLPDGKAGKPEDMRAKILEGKLNSYFKDRVLLEQAFIKDPNITIGGLIQGAVQKFGERTEIGRFTKFNI